MGHAPSAGWERAANRFLASWKGRPGVEGAVIAGSRVLGTATRRSDIDVMLVFTGARKGIWGTRRVGGYVVEYVSFTPVSVRRLFKKDLSSGALVRARLFGLGRIVFDRRGVVARLQAEARAELAKEIPPMAHREAETAKHMMWDRYEGVADLFDRRSPGFWANYHVAVVNLVAQRYARFVRAEIPPVTRWWDFLTSDDFRRRYRMPEFPDARFASLLVRALRARRRVVAMRLLRRLVDHALRAMGGFNEDRWRG